MLDLIKLEFVLDCPLKINDKNLGIIERLAVEKGILNIYTDSADKVSIRISNSEPLMYDMWEVK